MTNHSVNLIEVWGGLECTCNRVDDNYFDQLEYAGHYHRQQDLDLIASLGVTQIRYPVLWEKHQPAEDTLIDWTITEQKLNQLKQLGVKPIAGLVHHGSGPRYVYMADDTFSEGLARYANLVAEKFPWLEYYTPVNEPLTTARFCGLYGIWYPHKADDHHFAKILLQECKGTVLAMQAIRKINPNAKLVQTDDLGKIHSTPLLQYQADFENNRRWLTFDLLCGKITPEHPMWAYFIKSGIEAHELQFFLDNVCPPDVIGVNHYLTSERYIDERLEVYPPHTHGTNGKHRYADVEAVRVAHIQPTGPYGLIKETCERYPGIAVAVTEVHLHCTREEQMRWLQELWQSANQLKEEGYPVKAITAWAVLGSFGWNKLLTKPNGTYEPGIFDVQNGAPRSTVLSRMLQAYSRNEAYEHPVLHTEGWWKRSIRVEYSPEQSGIFTDKPIDHITPMLIIGKSGKLGNAFARLCDLRGIKYQLVGRQEMDITNLIQVEKMIQEHKPWAIVNTAGFDKVDAAEAESKACFLLNTYGAQNLAVLCKKYGIKLLTFSTDHVFDGRKNKPYTESDIKAPLNIYGHSKALAEKSILKENPDTLVIRTSDFFSPWDKDNFVHLALDSLQNNREFVAASDVLVSPTYLPDLIRLSLDLLLDDENGVWHLTNQGAVTWATLAYAVAEQGGFDTNLIKPTSVNSLGLIAPRPSYSVLRSEKGAVMPSLEEGLQQYFAERAAS
ncbi:SDR family oxidoreductase [Mucilaginibacter sp. Bleaf8]|uniref:SDR family oxidoreductase n=1 Tax=Mucilaginibacter sp. Bleaf8 TaxID=2834430 RepID=UPI001BCED76A|nr:family 1 glycosylhydrolase [Mucilaginibacter sp. Bleaf8]MBS7564053.1 SDR family oxidoreductase [Mucilaginibacter sp. Bleaf8]